MLLLTAVFLCHVLNVFSVSPGERRLRGDAADGDDADGLHIAVITNGQADQRTSRASCPVDHVLSREDGRPGSLHIQSVQTALDYPDSWWTEDRAAHLLNASSAAYKVGTSAVHGCGVFANRRIPKGARVDRVWEQDSSGVYPNWLQTMLVHITPWFGSGINHCSGSRANMHVGELPDDPRRAWAVASRDIEIGEELFIDYNDVFYNYPLRAFPANPFWTC
eukprot:TRINITY_DN76033_c0_g1_i1.p1 TRINITY_DN76033_c0_g1~~TRINITY_DN76033_c0_g1_i1.p1  ORF type:complete len:221 (+),score=25.12 TRINITY_DN76033_c0_g1_i1:108-770(+)